MYAVAVECPAEEPWAGVALRYGVTVRVNCRWYADYGDVGGEAWFNPERGGDPYLAISVVILHRERGTFSQAALLELAAQLKNESGQIGTQ